MIFNSLTYLLFLSVIVLLYWRLPRHPRLWLIFAASLLFYGFWSWAFIPLLLFSVLVDYTAGLLLGRMPDGPRRRAVLVGAVTANLVILGVFKYLIFFSEQLQGLADAFGIFEPGRFSVGLHIVLPLGISFYTFQSMSYTIDVWRRVIEPRREFVLFASYVIFFPQLVAGPILRAGEVIWQLDRRPAFQRGDMAEGLWRIGTGLFLKCVLADNIASFVDAGFARDAISIGALDVVTLAFLFGFQIYFDFAAYSHIAIGSARLMGIVLPENFEFPYLAQSPRDFWRRWHISLGSWIRDYLYLPLCGVSGGSRSQGGLAAAAESAPHPARRLAALWATWFLMGLWHGANWTFIVWGLWHAALVSLQRGANAAGWIRMPATLAWAFTLTATMIGWIPFRAESLTHTFELWGRLVSPAAWLRPPESTGGFPLWLSLSRDSYYVAAAMLLAVLAAGLIQRSLSAARDQNVLWLAWAQGTLAAASTPLIVLFLQPVEQFIYFQF